MKCWLAGFFCFYTAMLQAAPTVKDAWIPEAPPVSKVMAAFMVIQNPDAVSAKITAATSEQFGEVQMHLSQEENGMAKMLPQKELAIPAKGELVLKQGSYHLMLFDPKASLKAGDKVQLVLKLGDGSTLPVTAEVKKMGGMKTKQNAKPMKCAAGKCGSQ